MTYKKLIAVKSMIPGADEEWHEPIIMGPQFLELRARFTGTQNGHFQLIANDSRQTERYTPQALLTGHKPLLTIRGTLFLCTKLEGSRHLYVVKALVSEEDETHHEHVNLPAEYTAHSAHVYHARLLHPLENGWTGLERSHAIVYRFIKDISLEHYFYGRFQNHPLSELVKEYFGIILATLEAAEEAARTDLHGVWDFRPGNVVIRQTEGVKYDDYHAALIDYAKMNLNPFQSLFETVFHPFINPRSSPFLGFEKLDWGQDNPADNWWDPLAGVYCKTMTRVYTDMTKFTADLKQILEKVF